MHLACRAWPWMLGPRPPAHPPRVHTTVTCEKRSGDSDVLSGHSKVLCISQQPGHRLFDAWANARRQHVVRRVKCGEINVMSLFVSGTCHCIIGRRAARRNEASCLRGKKMIHKSHVEKGTTRNYSYYYFFCRMIVLQTTRRGIASISCSLRWECSAFYCTFLLAPPTS